MLIKCGKCGKEFDDVLDKCPFCGTINALTSELDSSINKQIVKKNSHIGFLYFIISLLALGLIGLGLYSFFFVQNQSHSIVIDEKNFTVPMDSVEESITDTAVLYSKENIKVQEKSQVEESTINSYKLSASKRKTSKHPQGHFSLIGKVFTASCHMDIDISGTEVTGSYFYDNQNSKGNKDRLYLTGEANGNKLELYEYLKDGQQTGYFDGNFNGVTYTGTFLKFNGQTMKFSFKAQ